MNGENPTSTVLDKDRCLVCNAFSKGVHNKCRSCRACAGKKVLCKACRFEKCKSIGMALKRSTYNYIKSEDEGNIDIDKKISIDKKDNKAINLLTNLNILPSINIFPNNISVDLDDIIHRIKEIFDKEEVYSDDKDLLKQKTCFQNMKNAIEKFSNLLKMNSYDIMPEPNIKEIERNILFWRRYIILTAEMLQEIPEFSSLPYQNKIQVFRHFWPFWYILFRVWRAVEVFGPHVDFPCVYLDDNGFVKLLPFNDTSPNISHDGIINVAEHMNPLITYLVDYIFTPLKTVNPSIFEIAYLAIQNLFTDKETSNFPEIFHERNKLLLNTSCNELHEYYINTKKDGNYVQRITNLMKVFFSISRLIEQSNEFSIIGEILEHYQCNIFKSEIAPSVVI
uniref:NR LBD domain-containing protein n=1 Tax=Strongyloides papillosus TaxID=174720 RepID=A0A0N5BE67_STREA